MAPRHPFHRPGTATLAGILGLAAAGCVTVDRTPVVTPDSGPETSPTLAQPAGRTLKRKVVIARFSNESLYGKSVLLGEKASLIGQKTSDLLATRLAKSGQFLLFERHDPEPLLRALDGGSLGEMGLPADHLIVGSLSEFGQSTSGETGFLSRTRKQTATAKVNVRLVDARSSQVIYAEEGAGQAEKEVGTVMGMGTTAGYDSSLAEQAISAAISKLVSNLMENLLAQPWRSYLLARQGERLVVAGGALQGLKAGDRLVLKRRGERVKNPQTGLFLELPGTAAAVLEVVETFGATAEDQGSYCRVVSGEAPESDFSLYVVEEER